jgi:hypothetical protein
VSKFKKAILFKTLRGMLMTSSTTLLIGAMAMSTQFGDYLDNERLQYSAPLLVLLMAVLIASYYHAYIESKVWITEEGMEMARKMGYLNLHHMARCLVMLCLNSVTLSFSWMMAWNHVWPFTTRFTTWQV